MNEALYTYCHVLLAGYQNPLWYICDFAINPGDMVVAPIRAENNEKAGLVLSVEKCTEEEAPYNVDMTKHIIRRLGDSEERKLSAEKEKLQLQYRQYFPDEASKERLAIRRMLESNSVKAISKEEKYDYTAAGEVVILKNGVKGSQRFFESIREAVKFYVESREEYRFGYTANYGQLNRAFYRITGKSIGNYMADEGVLPDQKTMLDDAYGNMTDEAIIKGLISAVKRNSGKISMESADNPGNMTREDDIRLIFHTQLEDRSYDELRYLPSGTPVKLVGDVHGMNGMKLKVNVESMEGKYLGHIENVYARYLLPAWNRGILEIVSANLSGNTSVDICLEPAPEYRPFVRNEKQKPSTEMDGIAPAELKRYKYRDLIDCCETEKITLPEISMSNIQDLNMGSAVFKGPGRIIEQAEGFMLERGVERDGIYVERSATPGIWEMAIFCDAENAVRDGMAEFPELKMLAFAERDYWEVYSLYSAPGYGCVTKSKLVGYWDPERQDEFPWWGDPRQENKERFVYLQTGGNGYWNYTFPFRMDWERFDYLIRRDDGEFEAVTGLYLPKITREIEAHAFTDCTMLKKITISAGVIKIDADAFYRPNSLERPVFEEGANHFKWVEDCLISCDNDELILGWKNAAIPENAGIRSIGRCAFEGSSAKTIVIPASVEKIAHFAFKDSKKLEKITFEGKLPHLSLDAFEGCKKIRSIILPENPLTEVHLPGFNAAMLRGFVELMQSGREVSEAVVDGGNTYIRRNNILLTDGGINKEDVIIHYAAENKLIDRQTADKILSNARNEGNTEIVALILGYKNENQMNEGLEEFTLDDDSQKRDVGQEQFFAGKTFVVTGDLSHFTTRYLLKNYIEERGGRLIDSVSSKTSYLITNTPNSGTTKNRAAQMYHIPVISEETFLKMASGTAKK